MLTVNLVDVHCHLSMKHFKGDLDQVILKARRRKLILIVTSSISPDDFLSSLKIVNKYKNYVYVTLGLHPPGVTEESFKQTIKLIEKYKNDILGIGEVGLDFYHVKSEGLRKFQQKTFKEFIRLSKMLELPLIVHSRDAMPLTLNILREEDAHNVILHCFSGSVEEAKTAIKEGWFISIPTAVATRPLYQSIARFVPLSHMVLETDSPFLSPFKGQRNEPANVYYAASKVAEIKGETLGKIAAVTTRNALRFFGLHDLIL